MKYVKEFIAALLPQLLLLTVCLLVIFVTQCTPAYAGTIPSAAERHRNTLVRAAHWGFGMDAPISTMAAQVHQGSRWLTDARSSVGAQALAKFIVAKSQLVSEVYLSHIIP